MTVVYAREEPPWRYGKSIFLAGPTPRDKYVQSWRPRALEFLRQQGYDGVVFVPEDRPDESGVVTYRGDYDNQVAWETKCLHLADCIVFWIPRRLDTMPAFTTNVEWGIWQNSGKVELGAPTWAEKMPYLIHHATELGIHRYKSLEFTLLSAMDFIGEGALRSVGEREVPLLIWRTPSFQQWYQAQRGAGNKLLHAKMEYTFRVGPDRRQVFMWVLHVDIYVTKEDRYKSNEIVVGRPSISTIVAYHRGRSVDQTEIVLVREFRSPASNPTGFVWELPSGSSFKPGATPDVMAAEEFSEEVGMQLAPGRFVYQEARQLNATLSTHQADVFSVKLTKKEIEALKRDHGVARGAPGDSEQTYVEVLTLGEIRTHNYVDWANLGMIMHALQR